MEIGLTPQQPRPQRRPQRTCVGCRGRADRSELLRVVAVEGGGPASAVPDPAARLPGRGAWVHHDLACLDLADRRKAFARALRVQGPVTTAAVRLLLEGRAAAVTSTEPSTSTGSGSSPDGHQMSSHP